ARPRRRWRRVRDARGEGAPRGHRTALLVRIAKRSAHHDATARIMPAPVDLMPGSVGSDLPGRVLAGRYLLHGAIGTGASGRVYVADDQRLRRRVPVKAPHPG